jgi:hypothetical protein
MSCPDSLKLYIWTAIRSVHWIDLKWWNRRQRRSDEEKARVVLESLSEPRLVSATAR